MDVTKQLTIKNYYLLQHTSIILHYNSDPAHSQHVSEEAGMLGLV